MGSLKQYVFADIFHAAHSFSMALRTGASGFLVRRPRGCLQVNATVDFLLQMHGCFGVCDSIYTILTSTYRIL